MKWLIITAAAGIVLAASLVVILQWNPAELGSYDSNISAYTVSADGYVLTLTASSGTCGEIVAVSADERPAEVQVSARAKDPANPGAGCPQLVATNHTVRVRLKQPLDGRIVVNSHGYPISPAPSPAPS